ncbi:hypothetical protein ACHAWF_017231 [Thalassiosira exigua]
MIAVADAPSPPGGGDDPLSPSSSSALPVPPPSAYDESDERRAARAASDAADERWRSLVAQHAPTFAASERRTASIRDALGELLREIEGGATEGAKRVGWALGGDDPGKDGDGEEEDDDDRDRARDGRRRPAPELLADLAEKHRLRRRTLMQHSSLLELLELPNLMDACVRSGLYEDALGVAGFANALERRHPPAPAAAAGSGPDGGGGGKGGAKGAERKADVVAGVVAEIRRREADLRRMLVGRLRRDVTMPQCLEVVTALRRLNGVELERRNNDKAGRAAAATAGEDLEGVHAAMEMRLQVDFLEARDAWLEGGTAEVGSARAAAAAAAAAAASDGGAASGAAAARAEQMLDGIERYRTRCFEIVTQFLAIFRGSFAPTSSSSRHDHSSSLLSMWTARRVQTFLTTLSANVHAHVHDTAALRDALDAASFFASSMGRVGADFQPLLAPIFEPRLVEMVAGRWNEGLTGMTETLKACRDAGVAGPLFGTETSSSGADGTGSVGDGAEAIAPKSSRTPAPPRKLLALPPLARFLNAYLGGLNELRRCLLPGAFPAVRAAQATLVADARAALQANERAVLTPGLRGEAARLREVASRLKSEFDDCLEPYMAGCLEVALGSVDYAMKQAKEAAAARAAERARVAAEKARAEEEARALEKAKAEAEALTAKEAAEAEALAKAKAEAEALEKSRVEAIAKDSTERIDRGDIQAGTDQNAGVAEVSQQQSDPFDDEDDMYGSD